MNWKVSLRVPSAASAPKAVCGILVLAASVVAPAAYATPPQIIDTARFTLHFEPSETGARTNPRKIAMESLQTLDTAYSDISHLFGVSPTDKVTIRFLSPKEFHRYTGAPEWTSAMYLRGEISIPISETRPINKAHIDRAVRHEYVHAVTAEISGRSCPAWLDEGLAQIIEGDPNPVLGPALRRWLGSNDPMPLDWLTNGFTTLSNDLVPAAYAESLFATRMLLARKGYPSVTKYLQLMKSGVTERAAFRHAFGLTRKQFEGELRVALDVWKASDRFDP